MSTDKLATLPPAVAALGATVELQTFLPVVLNDFGQTVKAAIDAGQTTFVYGGTEFTMVLNSERKVTKICVELPLGDPLPEVFATNQRQLSFVLVKCPVPETLLAKPGWYVGLNYGFADGACSVDPTGEHQGAGPLIYANSGDNERLTNQELFDAVTGLFTAVMSGKIVHNGDNSGRIIRA